MRTEVTRGLKGAENSVILRVWSVVVVYDYVDTSVNENIDKPTVLFIEDSPPSIVEPPKVKAAKERLEANLTAKE